MTHYLIMSESVYRMCVCFFLFLFQNIILPMQCFHFWLNLWFTITPNTCKKKNCTPVSETVWESVSVHTANTTSRIIMHKKKRIYRCIYVYTRICISICISTNNTFTLGSPHELQATGSEDRTERVHFVQFAARKRGKMQDGFGWFKSSAGTKITLKLSNCLVAMAEVQTWCAHQKPFTYSFILLYLFLEFFFLLIYLFFIFFFCILYSSHFVFWFYYFCVYYFSLNAIVWKPRMWLHIMSI